MKTNVVQLKNSDADKKKITYEFEKVADEDKVKASG